MKTLQVTVGPMRVQAEIQPSNVETLGVQVRFSPEVPAMAQKMALEQVMLAWKKAIGSVTRGGDPRVTPDGDVWLPGWTCAVFQEGTVMRMGIGFKEKEKENA